MMLLCKADIYTFSLKETFKKKKKITTELNQLVTFQKGLYIPISIEP